jgi:outer membrane lipoprotein SlyB
MGKKVKIFAIAAALAANASSAAMAQCVPGYALRGVVCQPVTPQGYSNPVSGAVSGEAAGAASGYRAGGPIGAVVGGALGTAAGTLSGTASMLTGSPPPAACARGYQLYNGHCYPNR